MTDLATLLPGEWEVRATNFPMWLTGRKLNPRFRYELLPGEPLRFDDTVVSNRPDGRETRLRGIDTLRGDSLVWRGRGLLWLFASRWRVIEVHADDLVTIEFDRTLATPAGRDVIARAGVSRDRVEAVAGGLVVL